MKREHDEMRKRKEVIRKFLQNSYGDEELSILLAHMQEGNFKFHSCCCFIGIATIKKADHAVGKYKRSDGLEMPAHYVKAKKIPGSHAAENAVRLLPDGEGMGQYTEEGDRRRIRILIPMVRAEIRRRDRLVQSKQVEEASVPTYGG